MNASGDEDIKSLATSEALEQDVVLLSSWSSKATLTNNTSNDNKPLLGAKSQAESSSSSSKQRTTTTTASTTTPPADSFSSLSFAPPSTTTMATIPPSTTDSPHSRSRSRSSATVLLLPRQSPSAPATEALSVASPSVSYPSPLPSSPSPSPSPSSPPSTTTTTTTTTASLLPPSSLTLPSFPSSSSSSSSSPSSPSSPLSSLTSLPHSHSHSHSIPSPFPSLTLPLLPSTSISSLSPSTHSSPPVPVSSLAASLDDITPTTAALPAAKTAPEQQDEPTTTHDDNNSSSLLVEPLETKETHLPASVAHPHPRSRQPLSPEQKRGQEELHHPTRPLSPLSPAAAAPRANIINNKGRYQQEQGQRQGQRRLLSPAGRSLSFAFRRQTAPFLFGLGPLSLSLLFPFRLVVIVSPPSTTTTDNDRHTSLLGHHCCPTDLFLVPFNLTCCCHHSSSTYTTYTSRGSLPFLLQRALLSHLQSWSLQSLFVAYSLPLLVCLTPGLVLPLSIFQILSLIASSPSSSPSSSSPSSSSPSSSDQPHSSSFSSPSLEKISIATNNSNIIKNTTSSSVSRPSSPSFLFSFFASSPSSSPKSTHRRHFRSSYPSTHTQTTATTTTTTTRQTPMASSSSSSSSSNMTGSSSSSFRLAFPPPLPLPPPPQAPWSPTSSSSASSSSASSSSSTSTITAAARTQAQASSHRPHFNQHAFAPLPPPPPPPLTQTQQQQQLQFRQPLPRHSNNTEPSLHYGSEQQYHEQHHNHNHEHEHEHDHEYDHGSDDESEGDAMSNEMEYYLQRCSICFDSRLDFCLEMCRDQFCRDCFQKYVKEVVSNSWGLDVTKIKCPVCQDPLPLTEWSKYVDQTILAQYQQYNQPYRSFSRFCNGCDNEVAISRVKQSILGLPSRDLLPLFETLLEQLKSLLFLGGLNPEASSTTSSASTMFSSIDGRKRHKHSGTGLLKRDIRAQELVQQFIKDYRLLCGTPQGNAVTIPSMAQSYFSSLAMRALGGGSAPPVPASPPANLGQHSNARVTQSEGYGAPGGGQSVGFQQHLDARPSHPQQNSAYRPVPSSLFQQKQQQPVTATGVLEMYKDLMVSLIELFDLNFPEQNDSVDVMPRTDAMKESEAYGHLSTPTAARRTSASDKVVGTDLCGGVTIETVRIPKWTIADRSKIVTRRESKRQLEVKKALVRFSKELLSLEVRPEQWKELQFLHVRWCRWDWCNNCDLELCLQCGVSSHHESETCFEHMRSVITTNTPTSRRSRTSKIESHSPFGSMGYKGKERSDLDTGTMQWKLANTNPCPNCCILIHRDDGCNKVDCMLCGHRFCWVCREAWDVGCGFFRCRLATEEPAGEKESDDQWEKHPNEWENDDVQAADQVETLAVAMGGELPHAGQGQADAGTMRHDRRRRRSDDFSAAISEKPEIGVPNVFMIQAKRSRA